MRIFQACVIFLICASNHSQGAWGESSYGFLGGVTSISQSLAPNSNAPAVSSESKTGALAGAFGETYLNSSWVISPGLFYIEKGAKDTASSTTASYLEVSSQLRLYLIDNPGFRSYLGFGASFGILLSADTTSNAGQISSTFGLLNKNELSGQVGAGFEFPVGSETGLQFGALYIRGLTNHLRADTTSGMDGKWQGFYGFVALRFKSNRESSSSIDRAMDYLKWKNSVNSQTAQNPELLSEVKEPNPPNPVHLNETTQNNPETMVDEFRETAQENN